MAAGKNDNKNSISTEFTIKIGYPDFFREAKAKRQKSQNLRILAFLFEALAKINPQFYWGKEKTL